MRKSRFTDSQNMAVLKRAEGGEIADWLIRLTDNNRNWGFELSFLYMRNLKGYGLSS